MPYIIGTAGHIDHGKTSLIKALTGQDTDRLKEEKERGISIDLGFAHLELPDGTTAGVVDVPGHEKFIRNMLAGAHGIDLVLFTVAADDGVMPQTEEHFDIVHLLGVKMAVFVITKTDLVPLARVLEVEEEIRILTLGTALENAPIVAVSTVSGEGLEALTQIIAAQLKACDKPAPNGYFRLPIDRAFILQGHGVIVTGTALSGEVRTGDRVRSLPGDQMFRVRSIQVHGRSVDAGGWGQRVALNLTGPDRADVARGHVICHEKITLTSERFDAFLEVRPAAAKGLRNHQRVRVHLGTAERLGKVVLLGNKESVEPKASTYCQMTVSEPLLALRGDHFILRDETAQRTLAGGMVVDPWAQRHKRGEAGLQARLELLKSGDFLQIAEVLLDGRKEFALPVETIQQFLNITEQQTGNLLAQTKNVRALSDNGERLYTTEKKWLELRREITTALREFHASHRLLPGMDMEELRGKLSFDLAPRLFRAIVDLLINHGAIAKEENLLRLSEHRIQLAGLDKALMEKVRQILGDNPMAPPELKDIEKQVGTSRAKLSEIMRLLEREGSVIRVAADLYFPTSCVDKVRELLYKFLTEKGEITAAGFRDLLGSSRKYTIALLEHFDRVGVTVRVGDIRRLKAPLPLTKSQTTL